MIRCPLRPPRPFSGCLAWLTASFTSPALQTSHHAVAVQVAGHVITKRAPGTLSFHMRPDGAVAPASPYTDVSHRVHHLTFGPPAAVEGYGDSHRDSLAGAVFAGAHPNMTHEHTLRLTAAARSPMAAAPGAVEGAYAYTVETRSHTEDSGALPAARFTVQP